jgi:dTDP-4-amino-4,6-dideoxygalactose transaminase
MTTGGEGGMVTTNDRNLWARMWAYKDHGKSWEAVYEREHAPGFRWLHESFGTNWRMTEMQAAIGRIQLRRMDSWHAERSRNLDMLWQAARQIPGLRAPLLPTGNEHAAYKGYVFVEPGQMLPGWNRDRILQEINQRGVPCYTGSCSEVYLEKAFEHTGWRPRARLPIAKKLGETSLMFLLHPGIDKKDMELTVKVLAEVMGQATAALGRTDR